MTRSRLLKICVQTHVAVAVAVVVVAVVVAVVVVVVVVAVAVVVILFRPFQRSGMFTPKPCYYTVVAAAAIS